MQLSQRLVIAVYFLIATDSSHFDIGWQTNQKSRVVVAFVKKATHYQRRHYDPNHLRIKREIWKPAPSKARRDHPLTLSTQEMIDFHDATFFTCNLMEPLTSQMQHLQSLLFISIPMPIMPSMIFRIQRVGENIFAAMFVVAFAQAFVALIHYRTNPSGELIVPPGLTIGTVEPMRIDPSLTPTTDNTTYITHNNDDDQRRQPQPKFSGPLFPETLDDEDDEKNTTISIDSSRYSRILKRVNRWLVVLLPWTSEKLGLLLRRNTHLFHFGFIIFVACLFDIPNRWIAIWQEKEKPLQRLSIVPVTPSSLLPFVEGMKIPLTTSSNGTNEIVSPPVFTKSIERIIVIGDSLAVGLGSCPIFDAAKNNSLPFYRIENLNVDSTDTSAPGPAFPRALAETLANHYQTQVHWRSAGVDGGDVGRIREYCLGVIQEEVIQGRSPDAVVVLCGVNDLKYYVSNPFGAPGPRCFRQGLTSLLREIQLVAPDTQIVLPMFPTQMFRANSPLNIFPLNFFLDAVVGFWDSQKKLVADRFPSDSVLYFGLPPTKIYDWYQSLHDDARKSKADEDDSDYAKEEGLIAPDGIHPNAKCYALWAQFLGEEIVNCRT